MTAITGLRAGNLPVADDAGPRRVPERCEAMLSPEGGYRNLREWVLEAEKCMAAPTVIVEFRCDHGHAGQNAKCDPHGYDDRPQFCGYCADVGARVPVTVTIVRRL